MSEESNSKVNVSIDGFPGTCSIVGIILIVCKIFGVINWSWWWVLLPFWGPLALAIVFVIICCIVAAVVMHDDD